MVFSEIKINNDKNLGPAFENLERRKRPNRKPCLPQQITQTFYYLQSSCYHCENLTKGHV